VDILAWPLFTSELTPERYVHLDLLILYLLSLVVLLEHISDQLSLFDALLLLGVLVKEILEELEHLLALQVVQFHLRLLFFDGPL
jgi:hypothetical protein